MDSMQRLFIAVEIPKKVQQEVACIQQLLRTAHLFEANYTDPKTLHITLKFLGDVQEDTISKIHEQLQNITIRSMRAQLDKIDFFVSGKHIKIIYLNVLCTQMAVLAQEIETTLQDMFVMEERNFVSHITLARIKNMYDEQACIQLFKDIEVKPITFSIDSFSLKKSELTPGGPMYSDVSVYELGK